MLIGWSCPEDKPTHGEVAEPEFCIADCPHKCMAPGLIAAMTKSAMSNYHKGKYLSATSLTGCTRKLKLERTEDYYDYMKNVYYSYRGTLLHQITEDAAEWKFADGRSLVDLGFLVENRISIGFCFAHGGFRLPAEVDAHKEETWDKAVCPKCVKSRVAKKDRHRFILSGTMDSFHPDWKNYKDGVLPGIIWDYKSMADYAMSMFVMGQGDSTHHPNIKDEHFIQLHVYKYLFEIAAPPKMFKAKGVQDVIVTGAEIQGISMNDFPRTGASYRLKSMKTGWKPKDFTIPTIEMKDNSWTEEFIKKAAWDRYQALILGNSRGEIIAPDGKKDRHCWSCDFCPFHKTEFCPNPMAEWKALKEGKSTEEAFYLASQSE